MPRSIGIVVTDHLTIGVVEGGAASQILHPSEARDADLLRSMPSEELIRLACDGVVSLAAGQPVEAVGIAFPGFVRGGVVEEAPNFSQFKGCSLEAGIGEGLRERGISAKVKLSNDADAIAAGIAARHNQLDQIVRVWTLGNGIGFGRYPAAEGVWEGGHTVVSLDPKERYCGCGGQGHLEGIMGNRAIRLRFLDLEPEEVFAAAINGDDGRCAEFLLLWHRALAAATASSIHMVGPGKFYLSGQNARFVNASLLNRYLQDMVMMSSLQGYVFEIVEHGDEVAVAGSVINALG